LITPAGVGDVEAIVTVFWRCWTQTYAEVLAPSLIARLSHADATAMWRRALDEARPGEVLVAVDAPTGPVLGVTRFVTSGRHGQVHSLYVSPAAQCRGVGRALLGAATASMADRGARTATLWVFAANAPSRAFYARLGWQPDGATRVQDQFGEPEVRLARALVGGGTTAALPRQSGNAPGTTTCAYKADG
jgi:ribosomal protein S18 acetylase RimI-like enzyme